MTSSLNDAVHPGTLFSGAHYNPYGELISDSLGNGVNESFSYDVRGAAAVVQRHPRAPPRSTVLAVPARATS
jgi:hypothetical protein